MSRSGVAFLGILCCSSALADRLYSDGFEIPVIAPLFPLVDGEFQLPPGPTADQLAWVLSELAVGETTTFAEIDAHFDASWSVSDQDTQNFFASLRSSYPNAVATDVIAVTPVRVTVVIDAPGSGAPYGFVNLGARYTGAQGIVQFGVSNYGGSVHASQLRATASIFKIWVLGGVARAVAEGTLATEDLIAMVASELAPGGTINVEPPGTLFSVADLATLMMGISDNTATDLLHEQVGRTLIGELINDYDVAQPEILTPLLGISEQFHLLSSFPLDVSQAYVNGTEAYQQQFLEEEIEPLGSLVGDPMPYFHESLLTSGTWRASPMDVCHAFAHLRRLPQGSDAIELVDRALGAQATQPEVRKGGSLNTNTELRVLTHAWMLQNSAEDPYVVVAMSNSDAGDIDDFKVQSVTGRMLQLLAEMP